MYTQGHEYLFFLLFTISLQVQVVLAVDCTFYEGTTAFYKTCTDGCCDTDCCVDNFQTISIILGTACGCVFAITIIVIIVVCCTKNRWSNRGVKPRKNSRRQSTEDSDIVLTDVEQRDIKV